LILLLVPPFSPPLCDGAYLGDSLSGIADSDNSGSRPLSGM